MSNFAWISICLACISVGYCVGMIHSYLGTMKRMRVRADDEMRRMDELSEACKKQIERAYADAKRLIDRAYADNGMNLYDKSRH